MNTKNLQIIIILAIVATTSLACNLGTSLTAAKTQIVPNILTPDTKQLENQLATQVNEAISSVPMTIELTESQITSLISSQTANQQDTQLSNTQVLLENNQMVINGDANAAGISGKINIILDVSTDAAGKPQLMVSKAVIGAFPIPSSLLETLSQVINQTMLGQGGEGFEIQSLTIADHKMIITGHKK
jgi:uncharacterized protein YpmS